MAKLNNFRGFARNISEPTHNDCLLSKKTFNSKRKIPIFHCATSKTLLANIPDVNDIIYCQIQAKNPIYLTQLGYEQNQPIPL